MPPQEEPMPIDSVLRDILVCPKCKGRLEYRASPEALLCQACRLSYRVEDDIPVMLIDEAEPIPG